MKFSPTKIFLTCLSSFLVLSLFPIHTLAQTNLVAERLGLSCEKILKMKTDKWSEYYTQRKRFSEADQNIAFVVYGDCHQQRNNSLAKRLSPVQNQRIARYRKLFRDYRVASEYLTMAYAGGGTLYAHLAVRGVVIDEEMVEKIINLYLQGNRRNIGLDQQLRASINRIRRKLEVGNPQTAKNRAILAEWNTQKQANTEYGNMLRSLNGIEAMLKQERQDVGRVILQYVDKSTNPRYF